MPLGKNCWQRRCQEKLSLCSILLQHHRNNLSKPKNQLCDDCVADGSDICYHQDISDEALLERLHVEAQEMLEQLPYLVNSPYNDPCIHSVQVESMGILGQMPSTLISTQEAMPYESDSLIN